MSTDKAQAAVTAPPRRRIRFWAAFPWGLSALLAVAAAWLAIKLYQTHLELTVEKGANAAASFLVRDARAYEREARLREGMYRVLYKEAKQLLKEPSQRALEARERQEEAALAQYLSWKAHKGASQP